MQARERGLFRERKSMICKGAKLQKPKALARKEYGDLSESSDNEAIGGLLDEHTICKVDAVQDEFAD